jgi:ferredoxin-NADP reductase
MIKVKLDHIQPINDHIKTFWFSKPASFSYIAGQFIEMTLPHKNVDSRGDKRWFTLSSSPSEDLISITTKFADKSSSFKSTLRSLKPGDEVSIVEPMGDFVLPKNKDIPLTYVAGGIGVTPIRSMLKWMIDKNENRHVQLIYAVSSEEDLVFEDLFSEYKHLTFTPVISNPSPKWKGETGQLSASRILDLAKKLNDNGLLYISGPEVMVETFFKELSKLVASNQLVTDYFPGYANI